MAWHCEHRATCGRWILMDSVSNRLGKSVDVSCLLKVISGLWHCSFLQLAVQVLDCCPIMACCTGLSHTLSYTLLVHSKPGNSSLEQLQHLWAADPSSHYNWSYGKNANLARNQPERMRMRELVWPPPAKPFLNKRCLAICVPVHQSGCPICNAVGDYFVLSSVFFIDFLWNTHMHTNYIAPSLSVVYSLDWPFCCVLSPASSFDGMWI